MKSKIIIWISIFFITTSILTFTYVNLIIHRPDFSHFILFNDSTDETNLKKTNDAEENAEIIKSKEPLVQYIAYLTYEKIISWLGIVGFIFFVVGMISVSILGFEIWNIRKSLEKTLHEVETDKRKLERKMRVISESFSQAEVEFNNIMKTINNKIAIMESDAEKLKLVRETALQDIDDIKKYLPTICSANAMNENLSEGFVKFCDIDENGKVVNSLWTIHDDTQMAQIPEINTELKSNTCVFLRYALPDGPNNGELILAPPKMIIEKGAFVTVLHSYTFQINPSTVKVWLFIKLSDIKY